MNKLLQNTPYVLSKAKNTAKKIIKKVDDDRKCVSTLLINETSMSYIHLL